MCVVMTLILHYLTRTTIYIGYTVYGVIYSVYAGLSICALHVDNFTAEKNVKRYVGQKYYVSE